jgi:signal transduction histidine kinase
VTFRRRLLLAQAPLAAALLLVGAASLRTVSSLGDSAPDILRDNYLSTLAAQRMMAEVGQMDRDALLLTLGRAPAESLDRHVERFEAALRLQDNNIIEAGEAGATEHLHAAWEAYLRAAQPLRAPSPSPDHLGPLQAASAAVRAAADEVLVLNDQAMHDRSLEAQRMAHGLLAFMLAATLGALALGLFASSVLTARTARPISELAHTVRRFGEGHLDARVRPEGHDEIADLSREFDTMAERLEQYRKSSLGELLHAQQSTQAAIDSLPDPVVILDGKGVILNMNHAAEPVLGVRQAQGVGQRFESLALEPAVRQGLAGAHEHVLKGNGPLMPHRLDEAIALALPDGPRRLLPHAAPLFSRGSAATGVSVVLRDVTRLARFDELKNDLVATVAHEFRTPLTSLQMAIHLCAEGSAGPVSGEQTTLLTRARKDCERLQIIVDDILDLSRIKAGGVEVQPVAVDGRELVALALAALESTAQAAGVTLEVEAPDAPLPVRADVERLGIVLSNLLTNAIRHAPASSRVVARVARSGANARFEVIDAGPGIPPQYQERLFERFFQIPGARRGGIGLGLYIAQEIVKAHGGEISVESEPGRGSTFWFTVPVV